MHHGPGLFVDKPFELFHSRAWTSSVRASTGVYPHLTTSGAALFPGDFIYYRCHDEKCFCYAIEDDSDDTVRLHIGRLAEYGYDMRTNSCTNQSKEDIALKVQPAFSTYNVDDIKGLVAVEPPLTDDELIVDTDHIFISEKNAFAGLDVFKDYQYGECLENPSDRKAKETEIRYAKYDNPSFPSKSVDQYYFVRRVISHAMEPDGDNDENVRTHRLVELCHTHPIRAELELEHYGRSIFEDVWDQRKDTVPVISLPVLTFIDGFGVFRNSYRSLMGYYITPCGLNANDRLNSGSIISLVLGPHGSDFGDVVKGLGSLAELDRGIMLEINGVKTFVCCWTMAFIGDMPQQAENCGFKSPRAYKYCRNCYIETGQQSFADPLSAGEFDSITHGRFHRQVKQMQQTMAGLEGNRRETYGSQWGMVTPHPALETIAPVLDLMLTRPFDPCHSEYNGLFCLSHFLLRDAIFTVPSVDEYTLALRVFQFPPGARRLQSPKHHLSSYEMSAHAVWGISIPIFLRQWLKLEHIKPRFIEVIRHFGDPIEVIIKAFESIIKNATVLMGYNAPKEDYDNLEAIVRRGREAFNMLCYCAAVSAPSRSNSRAGSILNNHGAGPATNLPTEIADLQYMHNTQRPNMHIAVHFHDIANEYAMMVNCNTLTGEDWHRWFKRRVYETNYSNVEKILLTKLNTQLTLRLIFRNAFKYDDPDLTAELQDLYRKCPNLFRRILARSDKNELEVLQEQDEFVLDVPPSANESHVNPCTINKIPTKEIIKRSHTAQGDGPLPVRARQASNDFIKLLRAAYCEDYNYEAHHPSAYELNALITWARKLSFDTDEEYKKHFVFSQGDFIQFRDDKFGRVDHIFLFDVWGIRHIFAIITPLTYTGQDDEILDLRALEEENEPIIIGITAIKPRKPYIVPVKGQYLLVHWDIKWM
ncbi:hypothetical protein F4781DRAFT_379564 [Annulohypoxylon bovei var. microspora]|nr:hypothetical protein F4781DRAFT_379564 [Annulohypoxylon bovei var. microspora]